MKILKWILKRLLMILAGCAAVIFALLTILTVGEYKPQAAEEAEIVKRPAARTIYEGDRIEILTFNVGYAGLDAGMDLLIEGGKRNTPETRVQVLENLQGLTTIIGGREYDAIFLQEVDRGSKRSYYVDEAEVFREQAGGTSIFAQNRRCLFVPYPLPDVTGEVNSGIQTLTGLDVRGAERIALPTQLEWPAQTWRMKPCLLVTRIPVEESGRELVLINLQMQDVGNGMDAQMAALVEVMKAEYEAGNYVIAGGDFDQVFPEDNFLRYPIRSKEAFQPERMEKKILDAEWTFASDRTAPTKRRMDEPMDEQRWWAQYYVLDGFILSPNVKLEEVETLDEGFAFSDHNPVRLAVTLE